MNLLILICLCILVPTYFFDVWGLAFGTLALHYVQSKDLLSIIHYLNGK